MSTQDTGGPAFPKLTQDERWKTFTSTGGMTLRDYFAAKALQGLLATDLNCAPEYVQAIADSTYVMADAMLKARGQ
jgi:hypothetical protein